MLTGWPSGPVCLVFSLWVSMAWATARAFSRVVTNFTPPSLSAYPTSWPAPRPPAWTWALMTAPPLPANWWKAASASSTDRQTMCLGMGAPAAASSSLAWYS